MSSRPQVYGSPGERARFAGWMRAALPLGLALLLCGYALGAAAPWPGLDPARVGWMLVAMAAALYLGVASSRRRVEAFFKGARGEELVARTLSELPGGYSVFHGLDLAGGGLAAWRGRDLDHVVVGPGGVWLVETKSWRGRVAWQDGRLTVDGRQPTRSPVAQAREEGRALQAWLEPRLPGLPPVRAVVCFTGQPLEAGRLDADGVQLCNLDALLDVLAGEGGAALTAADQTRIEQLLRERTDRW